MLITVLLKLINFNTKNIFYRKLKKKVTDSHIVTYLLQLNPKHCIFVRLAVTLNNFKYRINI